MNEKEGKKNILLLGASSLLNDLGSEAITPLLPFYISALGGGGIAIGLISGLRDGLASLLGLLGGWISDRVGKRKFLVFFGYFFSAIFKFMISIANSWQYVLAFVSLERLGKTRDAPRDAIIIQSTKKRGYGFGLQNAMDRTGAILGTLIVIFLFWKLQLGIKTIILIAAIISSFSLLPLFFVKEKKTPIIRKNIISGVKNLNPRLKYFIFAASVFTLGNFGLYSFLLLRAQQISGSIVIPLVIYAIFNLVYAAFLVPFGKLSDKIGRKKVLIAGYVLFLLAAVSFIFVQNIFYFAILFFIYGLVYSITQANQKALVSDYAGEMKGTAMGFYGSIIGVVTIFGGVIAGILWDISYNTMFTYISAIALISIVLMGFVKNKTEKGQSK